MQWHFFKYTFYFNMILMGIHSRVKFILFIFASHKGSIWNLYEISPMKHLWDISIETFMRYQIHYENYNKKIILSWYLINVKIRLLRGFKWNLYEILPMKHLWEYLVQNELFVIIFIMKLISHKCKVAEGTRWIPPGTRHIFSLQLNHRLN